MRAPWSSSATNRRAWGNGLHHVIDATTGLPTRNVIATWAIAETALEADGNDAAFAELDGVREQIEQDLPQPGRIRHDGCQISAALLDVEPQHAYVVGDSVWDLLAARRAQSIGIGLMSGGYGREELERAGAYRVYADPAELLARADELGVRGLTRPSA